MARSLLAAQDVTEAQLVNLLEEIVTSGLDSIEKQRFSMFGEDSSLPSSGKDVPCSNDGGYRTRHNYMAPAVLYAIHF
ncbi:hypothetical protein JG687_00007061 [Phytophthora cactorum]|uniref:Uncharacterized protein n=1 Tax=Phytophthora cactorum TaxID=29920 RepID=A0A329RW44_9STRA|nr:hypothetical protein Pcac1_g24258 [Phytophthora cactorum]KAG2797625.1 hypothetical protein PC111_g21212 [Phytophthora cactorum]KAG2816914.1 hypothetical protein PC112_g13271 [Phytophthora cactorum]KAG2836605.1 hypothetical protein PC113_g19998 [Phytophthora cactorum]KAG2876882.1 hypothetical protein PC114_g23953 [Phytophthora cactorum]